MRLVFKQSILLTKIFYFVLVVNLNILYFAFEVEHEVSACVFFDFLVNFFL